MAGDFYAAFGLGEDPRYIGTLDADGVSLAAIQGLYQLAQEQATLIEQFEAENAAQQAQIDDLQARLAALEQRAGDPASPPSRQPGAWLLLGGLVMVAGLVVQRRLPGGGR
jgi:DNA-binding transcriptional MerR regulator